MDIDSKHPEILHSLQYSCEEPEGSAAIEKESDYNYDTSYVDSESINDEVPSRHWAKHEKQVKWAAFKIFTVLSGR